MVDEGVEIGDSADCVRRERAALNVALPGLFWRAIVTLPVIPGREVSELVQCRDGQTKLRAGRHGGGRRNVTIKAVAVGRRHGDRAGWG